MQNYSSVGDRYRPSKARLASFIAFFIVGSLLLLPAEAAGLFVIRGTVTDVDGVPIAGATVTGDYTGRSAITDEHGRYVMEFLTPDTDYLRATAPQRNSKYRYVDSLTQRDSVDFFLTHRLVPTVSPSTVRTTEGLALNMTAKAGPRDDICMSMTVPGSNSAVDLAVTVGETASTGTAVHNFATQLSDGTYSGLAKAYPCNDRIFTLGSSTFSFRVDGTGPGFFSRYPVPGSTLPADEVVPSFSVSDMSGVKSGSVSLLLKDVTSGTERALSTTGPSWEGWVNAERFATEEGHSYELIARAEDKLGNISVSQWGFSVTAPVPTPAITQSAPYDYGERCERLAWSSCIGESSAIRTGSLKIATAGANGTGAGYLFMGAGIRYTVPRTGDIQVTADFADATGLGVVCAAAFRGDMDPVAVACAPLSEGKVTLQFRGTTGQPLKVGGYLMPACSGDETAWQCMGAATATVKQVSLSFLGAS